MKMFWRELKRLKGFSCPTLVSVVVVDLEGRTFRASIVAQIDAFLNYI